jgi:hypothetical protein
MKTVFLGTDLNPSDLDVNQARLDHICRNNDDAKAWLSAYTEYTHMIDDAVDGDLNGDFERAAKISLNFLTQCSFNPFYEKHKAILFPKIIDGVNAWCDSEIAAKHPDERIRKASDILKSAHADIVATIAYHVGGYEHMREISRMWRTFDFDQTEETKPE